MNTPRQGTEFEQEIRILSAHALANLVDALAANAKAYPRTKAKVILAEAARRIRWTEVE